MIRRINCASLSDLRVEINGVKRKGGGGEKVEKSVVPLSEAF